MKYLIPSKNQWKRWSLPSKLTAIGTLLAVISFLIWIINEVFPKRDFSKENYEILTKLERYNVSSENIYSLFNDLSKEFKKDIDSELFESYAEVILSIYQQLMPNAEIQLNQDVKGIVSKENYRVDILVKPKIAGHDLLLAIQLMPTDEPIKTSQLMPFKLMLEDIKASKGIVISNSGFEKDAIEFANKNMIDLCFLHDSESHDWKSDILIPVVWIEIQPYFSVSFPMLLTKGDEFYKDIRKWKVRDKKGGNQFPLLQLFVDKWNNKEIPHRTFEEKAVQINSRDLELVMINGKNKPLIDLEISYRTNETCWLKYFKPDQYKAIENYVTGNLQFSEIEMGISPLQKDSSWRLIPDYENIIKNEKISIIMTSQPVKIEIENMNFDEMNLRELKEI